MVELVGTLKDDNKDILIETDKYIKRVKQVENELGREKEAHLETQTEIRDLKRDLQQAKDLAAEKTKDSEIVHKKMIEQQVEMQ